MLAKFNQIVSTEALDSLFSKSFEVPVVLLKHSSTCGISADIMHQMGSVDGEINIIVIQENRELSNSVAERINHRHQSPQAFVIRDGKAIYHATHYAISPFEIEKKLK